MSSIELDGITFNYSLNIHFFRRISLAEYCACRLHLMCSDKSEREQITKFLPIAFGYAEKLLLVELFLFWDGWVLGVAVGTIWHWLNHTTLHAFSLDPIYQSMLHQFATTLKHELEDEIILEQINEYDEISKLATELFQGAHHGVEWVVEWLVPYRSLIWLSFLWQSIGSQSRGRRVDAIKQQ